MLARVNNQTKINSHLSFDKFQKTKDVIYSDGRRETHIFDQNLKQFNPQPSVVIKKERLEDLNINTQFNDPGYSGPVAWKNTDLSDFRAHGNDIIEWTGSAWNIVFDSTVIADVTYITNSYTGTQYKWVDDAWNKSYEGIYEARLWRLIL